MVTARRVAGLALLLLGAASSSLAQTVDEIVAKNIASRGGAERWTAIQTIKLTGTRDAGGRSIALTAWSKRPNRSRQEMEFQGQRIVQAFDGTRAWVMPPGATAPQEIKGSQLDLIREQAEFDSPLFDYKSKGNKVELVGTETLDGRSVYHLKLTRRNGDVQQYYLDADTGMERRVTSVLKGPDGQTATAIVEFGDYRDVDGVMVPFSIRNLVDDREVSQVTFSKVEFNVPIDDDLFQMPSR